MDWMKTGWTKMNWTKVGLPTHMVPRLHVRRPPSHPDIRSPEFEYIFASNMFFVRDECFKRGSLYFTHRFRFGSLEFRVSDFNLMNLRNSFWIPLIFQILIFEYFSRNFLFNSNLYSLYYFTFDIHLCPRRSLFRISNPSLSF